MKLPSLPYKAIAVTASLVTAGALLIPVAGASAAAAKAVLLGKSNKTTTTTSIQNTKGVALALKSKAGKAPFTVNSDKTVTDLSADRLDGLSAGSFARAKAHTGTIVSFASDPESNPNADPAICPDGSVLTGGGGLAASGIGYQGPAFDEDGNVIPNSWQVLAAGGDETIALATCWSPTGKDIPGSLEEGGDSAMRSMSRMNDLASRVRELHKN